MTSSATNHEQAALAGLRLPGMDGNHAAELLRLLPALGRVPDTFLLVAAGLGYPQQTCGIRMGERKRARLLRLLMRAYNTLRQSPGTGLGILCQRLRAAHPDSATRLCLAAILRHYNGALRHRRCFICKQS